MFSAFDKLFLLICEPYDVYTFIIANITNIPINISIYFKIEYHTTVYRYKDEQHNPLLKSL
jgi:hypothetical protein